MATGWLEANLCAWAADACRRLLASVATAALHAYSSMWRVGDGSSRDGTPSIDTAVSIFVRGARLFCNTGARMLVAAHLQLCLARCDTCRSEAAASVSESLADAADESAERDEPDAEVAAFARTLRRLSGGAAVVEAEGEGGAPLSPAQATSSSALCQTRSMHWQVPRSDLSPRSRTQGRQECAHQAQAAQSLPVMQLRRARAATCEVRPRRRQCSLRSILRAARTCRRARLRLGRSTTCSLP